ncbi:FecR family protein [Winogradskyella bathintestinalis]|uniref:FecR family protein n=1 Tax=Winogradskyella bathintestinalis TaxID=3035208 RepID=A0ABT7ZRU4_9FLAO|nr:FecR family protein [Winogradskyella bathintestinalis]MDN3491711.1 FecR family protein [Winogradskyella bathintestinalis]
MENEYLVKKWLNDELSAAEEKSFNALKNASLYKEIIEEAQYYKGDDYAKVADFNVLEDQLFSTKKNKVIPLNWIKIVSSIAAVLVIGFAVFSLLNKNNINSFATDLAHHEVITLPDNSIVKLNQYSQLDYNASDWEDNRLLNLNGEAYFDVEKGNRFEVKTNHGIVSVLGTEFNVYSRDNIFKVACYEGLVQITYNNDIVKVPAGTEFTLQSGTANNTEIVIAEPYWIKKMSVFDNASINDVIKELEKHYRVSISLDSDVNSKFTGAFEHNNLENALKSITQPLNLTFRITPNKVLIKNANKN